MVENVIGIRSHRKGQLFRELEVLHELHVHVEEPRTTVLVTTLSWEGRVASKIRIAAGKGIRVQASWSSS